MEKQHEFATEFLEFAEYAFGNNRSAWPMTVYHLAETADALLADTRPEPPAEGEPQVCSNVMHLHVWTREPFFFAVAQAPNVAEAREIMLEEIGAGNDGSCFEREAAAKWVRERTPAIWHFKNAEFALTDSSELREQELLSETLGKKVNELKKQLAAASPVSPLSEEQVRVIQDWFAWKDKYPEEFNANSRRMAVVKVLESLLNAALGSVEGEGERREPMPGDVDFVGKQAPYQEIAPAAQPAAAPAENLADKIYDWYVAQECVPSAAILRDKIVSLESGSREEESK